MRRDFLKAAAAACAIVAGLGGATTALAQAEDWPERPIQIVVPFGAGGDTDFNARMYSKYLEEELGVALPVVNITGASGSIAARQVMNAEPDGHTVLFFQGAMFTNTAAGISDFTWRDFELAAVAGTEPGAVITVRADAPWQTLDELVKASQEQPGEISIASGAGGTSHMIANLLNQEGAEFNVVSMGGSADRLAAVLGGNVDVSQNPFGQVKQYIDSGRLRGLGTLRPDRNPFQEDMPTVQEQGYDVVFQYDYFFLFPEDTPEEIVTEFGNAVKDIADNNEDYATEIREKYFQVSYAATGEEAVKRMEETEATVNRAEFN